MTFDEFFEAYYNLYRLEAETPASTDDEYPVAIRLANEAIARWAAYDSTYWQELFSTLSLSEENNIIDSTIVQYDAPDDFRKAGGYAILRDPTTLTVQARYAILEPQQSQFRGDMSRHCFFTGSPTEGYVLNINGDIPTNLDGCLLDYVYYKQPAKFVSGGSEITDMPEPYFMVHRALANRFRGSRNPYYGSAKADAEDLLKTMKTTNDSGTWSNPWKLQDNSGAAFGVSLGPGGFFD